MYTTNKKFISPFGWFSLEYPSTWHEFEDMEGSFLFYNPEKWTGNFRISSFQANPKKAGADRYAEESVREELKENPATQRIQVGKWNCAYSSETFQEEGAYYTNHLWITGTGNIVFECSFTVAKGGDKTPGEEIIKTLEARNSEKNYPKEIIPIRVMEIGMINEAYEFTARTVKKIMKKDFTASAEDIAKIDFIMQSGEFKSGQKAIFGSFGLAFGTILENEIDGLKWVTVIDGDREYALLRLGETDLTIDVESLVTDKIAKGEPCRLTEEFENMKRKIEEALN